MNNEVINNQSITNQATNNQSITNQAIENQIDVNKPKNKKIIIIIIGLIIISIAITIVYFLFKDSNNNNKILLYVNNDLELKYTTNNINKPILLSKNFDEESISVDYNQAKTKFLYQQNDGLYYVEVGNKEAEKISSDIDSFAFLNNNKFHYIDNDKNLYIASNSTKKEKLDTDVTYFIYNKNNKISYAKEKEIYVFDVDNNQKQLVMNNDESISNAIINNNLTKILFTDNTEKNLYLYDIKTRNKSTITNNLKEIIDIKNDFSNIIYTTKTQSKKLYELVINDDKKQEDQKVNNQCFIIQVIAPSEAQVSYPEKNLYFIYIIDGKYYYFPENSGRTVATKELLDSCSTDSSIDEKKEIRNQIRNSTEEIDYYDVYSYTTENKKLVENINSIINVNADNNFIAFEQYDINDKNKIKISEINSLEDYKQLENKLKYILKYYKDNKTTTITSDNKYIFDFIEKDNIYYTMVNDNKYILYKYEIDKDSVTKLSDSAIIINKKSNDYDLIYLDNYNENTMTGDLIIEKNNEKIKLDNDIYSDIEYDKNKNFYYYKSYNNNNNSGDYIINNINKNEKKTLENVSKVELIDNNNLYVFKDYSNTSKTYSLFKYTNNKYEPIEYNVKDYSFSK